MGDEAKAATIPAPVHTQATGSAELRGSGPIPTEPGDYTALPPVDPAHYTVLREVARGGMGRILEARDRRLGRTVAIKEAVHGDAAARVRFEREVRITARLQHPAIVAVHEAGTWPDGEPFFAMKRIHGRPLDARIAEAGTFARRLELLPAVIAVVDALAFAHSERVIHRDLKPANVLVGAFGETVVIDWGIAKDLAASDATADEPAGPFRTAEGDQTVEGAVLGTPSYMPPEQASGERVDERADVYALGALLYQVLAGVPPYEGRTTADVLDRVLHEAPRPLERLAPEVPADLVAIVEKAMARDPARRFRDAGEMATELKRFAQGQLVASHDYTRRELILRWIRRHRAPVAVGAVALGVLAVLAVIGIAKIVGAEERAEADAAAARARRDLALIDEATRALDEDPARALAIVRELSPGSQEWRGARTVIADALSRGVATVMTADGAVESLAFSLDGRALVSAHRSGAIHLWSAATGDGQLVGIVPGVQAVALEPAGTIVAFDEAGRIVRLRPHPPTIATPELVLALAGEDLEARAGFNARGDALVVARAGPDGGGAYEVVLVTLADRRERPLAGVHEAVWMPAGDALVIVAGSRTGGIARYDLATGARTPILAERSVTRLATDGDRLWTASWEGAATELRSGRVYDVEAPVSKLVALPGGRLLVSPSTSPTFGTLSETLQSSDEGLARRFHPRYLLRGRHTMVLYDRDVHWLHELRGHSDATLTRITVSAAGQIASGDERGTIRVWRLPADRREHAARVATHARLAADGTTLVIARLGPALEVRDLATGAERRLQIDRDPRALARPGAAFTMRVVPLGARRRIGEKVLGHADQITVLVASRDGRRLATLDDAGQIVAWDLDSGHGTLVATGGLHVAISPDGMQLALSRTDGSRSVLETWDAATGAFTQRGELSTTAIAFASADRFAVATQGRALFLFEPGGKVTELPTSGRIYRVLAFTPDGLRLVGGDDARAVGAWSFEPARRWDHQLWHGHTGTIVELVLSPDGTRVASASADHTVRVWDLATGTATHVLREHADLVTSLVWADADTLVTASDDRTARVWDLASDRSRALRGFESRLVYAARSGSDLVAVDLAHQIARFPDTLPRDERLLRLALDVAAPRE